MPEDTEEQQEQAQLNEGPAPGVTPPVVATPVEEAPAAEAAPVAEAPPPAAEPAAPAQAGPGASMMEVALMAAGVVVKEAKPAGQPRQDRPPREPRPPRADRPPQGDRPPQQLQPKREGRPGGGENRGPRPDQKGGPRPDRGDRGDRPRGDRPPFGDRGFGPPPDIELEKLISDSLYLDNQAHAVVSRMRDMDSGTKSQLRRFYNAVRRAYRAPEGERQHEFVMLRARLAYTIARHSLRSLDQLERLLLQVTRKNDTRGYERFRDLFEAIIAYNE